MTIVEPTSGNTGFVPEILNVDIIDDIVKIGNDESFDMAKRLAKEEGVMAGISAGAAVAAAVKAAKLKANKDKLIVVILPDTAERYLSTKVSIEARKNGQRGKIIIEFYSLDDFDRIKQ